MDAYTVGHILGYILVGLLPTIAIGSIYGIWLLYRRLMEFPARRRAWQLAKDQAYIDALHELGAGNPEPQLWARAIEQAKGRDELIKSLYIQLKASTAKMPQQMPTNDNSRTPLLIGFIIIFEIVWVALIITTQFI